MTDRQIAALFNRIYNGRRNFMTPDVIGHRQVGDLVCEISSGKGIKSDRLYGVTVLHIDGSRRDDLSTCFTDYEGALEHINTTVTAHAAASVVE